MTLKRDGKSDLNINYVGAWLLAIVSALGILTIAWQTVVWAVHQSELQETVVALKAQVEELKDEVKAMVSVQQTQGTQLNAVCEAIGVPVGQNSLATRPSLAYKPSKNENASQP